MLPTSSKIVGLPPFSCEFSKISREDAFDDCEWLRLNFKSRAVTVIENKEACYSVIQKIIVESCGSS